MFAIASGGNFGIRKSFPSCPTNSKKVIRKHSFFRCTIIILSTGKNTDSICISFTYVFKYYYVNALIFIGDFRSFSDLFGSPSSQLNCGKWLHQCNFNSWITSNALRPWKLQSLFNEIKPFSSCFQVVFSYVIRSVNSKADALAKAGGGEG